MQSAVSRYGESDNLARAKSQPDIAGLQAVVSILLLTSTTSFTIYATVSNMLQRLQLAQRCAS